MCQTSLIDKVFQIIKDLYTILENTRLYKKEDSVAEKCVLRERERERNQKLVASPGQEPAAAESIWIL